MIRVVSRMDAPFGFFLLAAAGFIWLVQYDPFFWDTIQLASKHAHFFYEHQLRWAPLPEAVDSGHPPLIGFYLATLWTLFGKTLPVGHWGMLPFLWLAMWMMFRLGKKTGGPMWGYWLVTLVMLDPVMLGQSALVSPDLMLAAFFLCSVDAFLGRNNAQLCIGLIGLCVVSMRGMMCTAAFFAAFLLTDRRYLWQHGWKVFLPGVALASSFLYWHWQATGWIGYHPGSPWAPAFQPASIGEMFRNVAIIGWRWLDFGRFALWICLGALLWIVIKKYRSVASIPIDKSLLVLFACLFVLLNFSALRYHNLSAHRYFLPLFLMFHLIVFQWIVRNRDWSTRAKKWVLAAISVTFALSNFQVYPHGISMDWDATAAHLPYHEIRAQGLQFLKNKHIPLSATGSAFPNINTGEDIVLDADKSAFVPIDTATNRFIFLSNVFNDVSKEERAYLQKHWKMIWAQRRATVWGEIYQK